MLKLLVDHISQSKITPRTYTLFSILFLGFISYFVYYSFSPTCYSIDINYHFNRLYSLIDAIRNGHFPNYMDYYTIEGYGYLVKNFYSDFIFIPFAIYGIITDAAAAYNLIIFCSTFFCAVFSFFAFFRITKNRFGAIVFAVLNTTASYRLYDLYIRGALGETVAICFLPLIIWGLYEIIYGDYKKWYILSVGYALLIYVHVISSFIVALLSFVALLLAFQRFRENKKRIVYLGLSALFCLILSAYFLIPFIQMLLADKYFFQTNPGFSYFYSYNPTVVLEGLFHLFNSPYGNFPKVGLLVFFPAVFLRVFVTRKNNSIVKVLDLFLLAALILIFLNINLFPWNSFPFNKLHFIQMGFRFIPMATILLTFCTGYYLSILVKDNLTKIKVSVFLIVLVLFAVHGEGGVYKRTVCQGEIPMITVSSSENALMHAEFLPSNFSSNPTNFAKDRGRYTLSREKTTAIDDITKTAGQMSFNIKVNKSDVLELPLTYYIGYRVMINGKEIEYQKSSNALINIEIEESGRVETKYVGTKLVMLSLIITALGFLSLCFLIIIQRKKDILKK